MGYNAIAFNGEGYGLGEGQTAKFVTSAINKLEKRFEHIVFYMDNDAPGITYSEKLSKKYNKKYIVNPTGRPKDISDYVRKKSIYNGKRLIKKQLSKIFKVKSGFLEFAESLTPTENE